MKNILSFKQICGDSRTVFLVYCIVFMVVSVLLNSDSFYALFCRLAS